LIERRRERNVNREFYGRRAEQHRAKIQAFAHCFGKGQKLAEGVTGLGAQTP
jgi:hypothetical protein